MSGWSGSYCGQKLESYVWLLLTGGDQMGSFQPSEPKVSSEVSDVVAWSSD